MRLAPLLGLLVLLAPLAAAQSVPPTDPGITLTLDATSASVDAGQERVINATITNKGSLAGSVTLALDAPANWQLQTDLRTFAIAASATQVVRLKLVAPDAGVGAATGPLGVGATFTEGNTGRSAVAQASVALTRIDPVPPPPPPGWTPEGLAVLIVGSILVIGAVVVAEVLRRRRIAAQIAAVEEEARLAWIARETGILVAFEGHPMPWGPRRELMQRLIVTNASDRPRVAHVGIESATPGWTAAVSLPRIALGPGESTGMSVYLNPSLDVPGGAPTEVVVYARPAEAQEAAERATLRFEAPGVRIPIAPPSEADAARAALRR